MTDSAKIEQLIERQARLWEVRERLAREGGEAARQALVHLSEGPWVTVSRQLGSSGNELAQQLAGQLDWQVYDREILSEIARHSPVREKILSRLDEHAAGHFNDYVRHLLVPEDLGQAGFLQEMTRVIWALARQGKAVILGRGANWFLDARFGLRVRVVAPVEVRVARLVEQEGLEPERARRRVRAHDAEQQAFIRQAYARDIDDALGYDLVLNLERIDLETATAAAALALEKKLAAGP